MGYKNAYQAAEDIETLRENYPSEALSCALNLLSSHDRPRIISELGRGPDESQLPECERSKWRLDENSMGLAKSRFWLATLMQMTFPGVPSIYYGDEYGLEGLTDPGNRRTLPTKDQLHDFGTLAIVKNASAVRRALLPCYPEDIRKKKLAARAATMAQSGQYNFPRLMRRGDVFGARLALAEFLNAALSMLYLLNFRYEPFYKWQFAGAEGLVAMSEALPYLKDIAASSTRRDAGAIARDIEAASALAISELKLQGLTDAAGDYLEPHAYSIMSKIEDPEIRGLHVMEG